MKNKTDIFKDKLLNRSIFADKFEPLKILSQDDSDKANVIYMVDAEQLAINFDKVKEYYAKLFESTQAPSSVDAILMVKDGLAFVEFKNGELNNKEKRNINFKLRDSLLMFCDIMRCTLNRTRLMVDFVLVYNQEKNPSSKTSSYENIENYVGNLANERIVRFQLAKYRGIYFRNIYTVSVAEFNEYLKQNVP